jgi:hypothetical protein
LGPGIIVRLMQSRKAVTGQRQTSDDCSCDLHVDQPCPID